MIYIKNIVIISLNNNKFLAILTYINKKKKLSTNITKFKQSYNTDTRLINKTCQKKKKKQNKPEGPNLTPSPGSHNDKLISDKQSYKTSQGGPK